MPYPLLDLTIPAVPGVLAQQLARYVGQGLVARRPASKSAVTVVVTCLSSKMGETFAFESSGESETMAHADMLESVASFRPQPVEVRYVRGGAMCRAFPDFGVVTLDGSVEIWEVKPERRSPSLVARLSALATALAEHGIPYRVRTPRWYRRQPHSANVRFLARHAGRPLPDSLASDVAALVPTDGRLTLGELRTRLGLEKSDICAAVARGFLAADIGSGFLDDTTVVRRPKPGARSGAYFPDEKGRAVPRPGRLIRPV